MLLIDEIEYIQFTDILKTPNELIYNQAPTSISLDNLSVSENLSGGFIANISGVDPDGDYLTYSVLSDHDGDMLEVNGSVLKFGRMASQQIMNKIKFFILNSRQQI